MGIKDTFRKLFGLTESEPEGEDTEERPPEMKKLFIPIAVMVETEPGYEVGTYGELVLLSEETPEICGGIRQLISSLVSERTAEIGRATNWDHTGFGQLDLLERLVQRAASDVLDTAEVRPHVEKGNVRDWRCRSFGSFGPHCATRALTHIMEPDEKARMAAARRLLRFRYNIRKYV